MKATYVVVEFKKTKSSFPNNRSKKLAMKETRRTRNGGGGGDRRTRTRSTMKWVQATVIVKARGKR